MAVQRQRIAHAQPVQALGVQRAHGVEREHVVAPGEVAVDIARAQARARPAGAEVVGAREAQRAALGPRGDHRRGHPIALAAQCDAGALERIELAQAQLAVQRVRVQPHALGQRGHRGAHVALVEARRGHDAQPVQTHVLSREEDDPDAAFLERLLRHVDDQRAGLRLVEQRLRRDPGHGHLCQGARGTAHAIEDGLHPGQPLGRESGLVVQLEAADLEAARRRRRRRHGRRHCSSHVVRTEPMWTSTERRHAVLGLRRGRATATAREDGACRADERAQAPLRTGGAAAIGPATGGRRHQQAHGLTEDETKALLVHRAP